MLSSMLSFRVGGVALRFGPANPEGSRQGAGMWNSNLDRDPVEGNFCVLLLHQAQGPSLVIHISWGALPALSF